MILFALLLLDFTAPARELVRRIESPEIALSVRNLSSLAAREFAEARLVLESELRARRIRMNERAAVQVQVTIAESSRQFVWTAEIGSGDERTVAIATMPRDSAPAFGPKVTIERRLVWEQDSQMLDVAMTGGKLAVLEPGRIVFPRDGTSIPLVAVRPSRDARGRLASDENSLIVYTFGGVCRVKAGACQPSAEAWILEGGSPQPGRNFFSLGDTPGFFSSAVADDGEQAVRLYAGVDGRVRLASGDSWTGWGSEIASVESKCGRLVLANRPSLPEAIQVYQLRDRRPVALGDPEELAGPVTALWSSGGGAVAIVRNPSTNRYAAFQITVACER